jgi:hypothetical protein
MLSSAMPRAVAACRGHPPAPGRSPGAARAWSPPPCRRPDERERARRGQPAGHLCRARGRVPLAARRRCHIDDVTHVNTIVNICLDKSDKSKS